MAPLFMGAKKLWHECGVPGCQKPPTAKGYCDTHYRRAKKWGDPLATARGERTCGHCGAIFCPPLKKGTPRKYCSDECSYAVVLAGALIRGRRWRAETPLDEQRRVMSKYQRRYRGRRYGLTDADLDAITIAQGGLCAICGESDGTTMHVDHDHDTGAVRGLLCRRCNWGLGHFRDNPVYLASAIEYLTLGHAATRRPSTSTAA